MKKLRLYLIVLLGGFPYLHGGNIPKTQAAFSFKSLQPPEVRSSRLGFGLRDMVRRMEDSRGTALLKYSAAGLAGDRVPVILILEKGWRSSQIDLGPVVVLGGRLMKQSRSYLRIEVPYDAVSLLPDLRGVKKMRLPLPREQSALGYGDSVSQSVALVGADNFHNNGVDGTGIKIAVLDFGFMGLSAAIAAGELPASTVGIDFTGTGLQTTTDHGTVVSELVMDMAPGATLFCLKIDDLVDFENAIDTMVARGIQVGNLSGGWYIDSYYDDTGYFNAAINKARDTNNIFFAVSAGNAAESHWRGGWSDGDSDGILDIATGDEDLTFTGTGDVYLNWDQYDSAVTDLDLLILDNFGVRVDSSINWQLGGADESFESVNFTYNAARAPYHAYIIYFSGPTSGLDMTLFVGGQGEILDNGTPGHSMTDPANAHGAFTVGSILHIDWDSTAPPIQPFSSRGTTNDGRMKPDIVGPDGTRSFTDPGGTGTSFSSPIVAGAAALLLAETSTLTAGGIDSSLKDSALDIGPAGVDSVFGYGKLSITPVNYNRAPVLDPIGNYFFPEGQLFQLEISAADPDGDSATLSTSTLPSGASFVDSGNGKGTLFWTPSYSQSGNYAVTFTVMDSALSDMEAITLSVVDQNAPPVITAQAESLSVAEEQVLTLSDTSLTITDLDDPVGPFSLTVYPGVNYQWSGDQILPDPEFNGVLTVPVVVFDGVDSSNVFNLSITVTPVNDPPVITGQDTLTIAEDSSFTLLLTHLSVSDTDNTYPVGFSLTVRDGPDYTHSGNQITPTPDFNGVVVVGVAVYDGQDSSTTVGIGIIVTPVNDPPLIVDQAVLNILEEDSLLFSLNYLAFGDPDNVFPDDFTLHLRPGPNYSVSDTVVTPDSDFVGVLTVPTVIFDGTDSSNIWNSIITVFPVNDPPVFVTTPDSMTSSVDQDVLYIDTVRADDSDGDTLYYYILEGPPALLLDSVTGVLAWTPVYNDTGQQNISVVAWDGFTPDTLSFTLTVNNVNDPPIITGSINNQALEDVPWQDTVGAIDLDGDPVVFRLLQGPSLFALDSVTGIMTWTPGDADTGQHSISIEVWDGQATDTGSFVLTVFNTTDRPVFPSVPDTSILEDAEWRDTVTATDADGDTLYYYLLTGPASLTLDSLTGAMAWTPENQYVGLNPITIAAWDGFEADTLNFAVTVINTNDAPSLDSVLPPGDTSMAEGDSFLFQIFASDEDAGDSLAYTWLLNGDSAGAMDHYWRVPDYQSSGVDTLVVVVSDGDTTLQYQWLLTISNTSVPPAINLPNGSVLTRDSSLSWPSASDPDLDSTVYYSVEISLDSSFDSVLAGADSLRDTFVALDSLLASISLDSNTTVYWRLNAYDSSGYQTGFTGGGNYFVLSDGALITSIIPLVPRATFLVRPPNPFHQVTVFRYGVGEETGSARVSLRIYNVNGVEVKTLVDAVHPPGYYSLPWNSEGAPAGVYYVYLRVGRSFKQAIRLFKIP